MNWRILKLTKSRHLFEKAAIIYAISIDVQREVFYKRKNIDWEKTWSESIELIELKSFEYSFFEEIIKLPSSSWLIEW